MRGVKYIAPYLDHSGYGEASRNYILALYRAGIPLTIEPRCFEPNPPPVGTIEEREILRSLENAPVDFDVVIVHLTPDLAPAYAQMHPGKYVISYTVWETSLLHPLWVKCCNQMDEVWVPSAWNVKAFSESGVTCPILKIPHGIDPSTFSGVTEGGLPLPRIDDDTFVFYSILQWSTRKNPEGLLRAYYNAFKESDNVRLVLKAYIGRGLPRHEDLRLVKTMVQKIKADMQLSSFPTVSLIIDSLSTEQMRSLHVLGDAYVSLTRGEGFGLTMMEAGLAGKPVIATGMGGNMEYMTPDNSYPVDYLWEYVAGMGGFNPWYWGCQQWAHPSTIDAADKMQEVRENYGVAKEKALRLQERIRTEFSWERVADIMVKRLKEI